MLKDYRGQSKAGCPLDAQDLFHQTPPLLTFQKRFTNLKKNKKGIPLNCIFIDQLELPSRTYNCLKRDLLTKTDEDLMQINSFRMEDGKLIWDTLEKHLSIDLPKNKFSL
jgi:DNA-directed RNA polymerase subunit alpha